MTAEDRIIDRDIEFYKAEAEFCRNECSRCATKRERYWQEREIAAHRVYAQLVAYRMAMDRSDL